MQDMLEVSVLKPCVLDLVEGMYVVEMTIFFQDQSLIWRAAICFQEPCDSHTLVSVYRGLHGGFGHCPCQKAT